jgi:hypothetical protein
MKTPLPNAPPCADHASQILGGVSDGWQRGRTFETMNKNEIMSALLEIINDESDLNALKSLIEERKEFLIYREVEMEILLKEESGKDGSK